MGLGDATSSSFDQSSSACNAGEEEPPDGGDGGKPPEGVRSKLNEKSYLLSNRSNSASDSLASTQKSDAYVPLRKGVARWFILSLACLILFGSYYAFDIPSALNTSYRDEFGLDEDTYEYQLNVYYSVYSFPNMILPLFGGYLIDRVGVRLGLLLFSALVCAGHALFTVGIMTHSFWLAAAGRTVFGIGGESLGVAQTKILTVWFSAGELAFALGMTLCVARLGSVANDFFTSYLASHASVNWACMVGLIVCVASFASAVGISILCHKLPSTSSSPASTEPAKQNAKQEPVETRDKPNITISSPSPSPSPPPASSTRKAQPRFILGSSAHSINHSQQQHPSIDSCSSGSLRSTPSLSSASLAAELLSPHSRQVVIACDSNSAPFTTTTPSMRTQTPTASQPPSTFTLTPATASSTELPTPLSLSSAAPASSSTTALPPIVLSSSAVSLASSPPTSPSSIDSPLSPSTITGTSNANTITLSSSASASRLNNVAALIPTVTTRPEPTPPLSAYYSLSSSAPTSTNSAAFPPLTTLPPAPPSPFADSLTNDTLSSSTRPVESHTIIQCFAESDMLLQQPQQQQQPEKNESECISVVCEVPSKDTTTNTTSTNQADASASKDELSGDDDVRLSDIKEFTLPFWLLCGAIVTLYGTVIPFHSIASDFLQAKFSSSSSHAGTLVGVPDSISAFTAPVFGWMVDRYGLRAIFLMVCGGIIMLCHVSMGVTMWNPLAALIVLGVAYAIYAAAIWPAVAYCVEKRHVGTAYGISSAMLNTSLTIFPLAVAKIQTTYSSYDEVELFFAGLGALSVLIGIALNWVDYYRNGSKLNSAESVPLAM